VTAVLIKFDHLRSSNKNFKNYNSLFTRDSYFVVKCLCKYLALKLLSAETSPHTTHWGHSSPFGRWYLKPNFIKSKFFFLSPPPPPCRIIYCRTGCAQYSNINFNILDSFVSHRSVFRQLHNAHLSVLPSTNEPRLK
jgi:hypothetical protein